MRKTIFLALALSAAALALGCETVESLTTEGNTAAAWQEFETAIQKYDAALAKDPSHIDAIMGKAKALEGAKKFAEAETWYKKVLDKKKNDKAVLQRMATMFTERGKSLYKEKKFAEAASWYAKVANLDATPTEKKTALDLARECRFQDFFVSITPKIEKLDGFDKKQKLLMIEGEGAKPKRGSEEDAQKAAFDAAQAKLNALAHKLSSKAKDKSALPTEAVPGAVPAGGDWVKPKKVFGLKLAIQPEKLARLIFEINEGGAAPAGKAKK